MNFARGALGKSHPEKPGGKAPHTKLWRGIHNILEGKSAGDVYAFSGQWIILWSFSIRMEMGPVNFSDTDLSPRMWIVSLKGWPTAFQSDLSLGLAQTPNQADLMYPHHPPHWFRVGLQPFIGGTHSTHTPCHWAPALGKLEELIWNNRGPFLSPQSLALFIINWFLLWGADA